jgi:hypothetical protein
MTNPTESPRRNRVDPFGDVNAVSSQGMFTGNRGCLVDESGEVVRHHRGSLWITCLTQYRDWRHPIAAVGRWTPIFFLDDAVALAAGHRQCGLCRREAYRSYRDAVTRAFQLEHPALAVELNRRLALERLRRGSGISRASHRIVWSTDIAALPVGSVIIDDDDRPRLVLANVLRAFTFDGWVDPIERPPRGTIRVLTPPTSVAALAHGFEPVMHSSATAS